MKSRAAIRRQIYLDQFTAFERKNFVLIVRSRGYGGNDELAEENVDYYSFRIVRRADFEKYGVTKAGKFSYRTACNVYDRAHDRIHEMERGDIPCYDLFTLRGIKSFTEDYDINGLCESAVTKVRTVVDFFSRDDRYNEERIRLFNIYDHTLYGPDIKCTIARAIFFGDVPYIKQDEFDFDRMMPYLENHPRVSDLTIEPIPWYNNSFFDEKTAKFKLRLTQEEWNIMPHRQSDIMYPFCSKKGDAKNRPFDLSQFYIDRDDYL